MTKSRRPMRGKMFCVLDMFTKAVHIVKS